MNSLVLATHVVQALASIVTALLMLRFWGVFRRQYFQRWGWSWIALAGYQAAAATGFWINSASTDPTHLALIGVAMFAVTLSAWHVVLLLSGTWQISDETRCRWRVTMWWMLASAAGASGLAVATANGDSEGVGSFVRITLPMMIVGSGFIIMGAMMLPLARPGGGIAARMLALTGLAYGAGLLASAWFHFDSMRSPSAIAIPEFNGLLTLFLQCVLAMGMLVWTFEIEHARASTAAAALGETETRLARVFEDVRLIAWEYDPIAHRFTYVSPQAEQLLGYAVDEWFHPEFWYRHVHPEDRERARQFTNDHTRRAENHEFEYRMMHKDGHALWIRDLTTVVAVHGEARHLRGVFVDVTQRHVAEEALQQSEQRLRAVFESTVDPLWDWDIAADQTTFSPGWLRLLEWPSGAEIPQWEQRVHPEDRPRALAMLTAALKHKDVHYETEYRLQTHAGNWKWVMSRGRVVTRGADGRALRMVGSITDITQRIADEHLLRESEARMRAIIDNAPSVAIQGYDLSGRVLFWNKAAETMFGWTEHEAVGKPLEQLMLDEEGAREFRQTLQDINRTGKPMTLESVQFARRDRSTGWCYSAVFRVPGGADATFICMDIDMTQSKIAEQALERSHGLQQLLLSELDHRVRNNLASLTALIDISSRDSRSVREFAASIRSRVQAMSVVHALLSREHWQAVDLKQLLLTLAPVGVAARLAIEGPVISIMPRQATAIGMVIQELFANSLKYGALARPDTGRIDIQWIAEEVDSDSGGTGLRIRWREHGGEPIVSAAVPGVGCGLIEGLVRAELGGDVTLRFLEDGASHEFRVVLDASRVGIGEKSIADVAAKSQ